jgi:ribosome-associated translation inhibitor RaiA
MPIVIRSNDFSVTNAIREHAVRRLGFALDSFAPGRRGVRRVIVRLGDLNGPKGGADKFCRISADVGRRTAVVEEVQPDLYVAISRAARRFARKAARELRRLNRQYGARSLPGVRDQLAA